MTSPTKQPSISEEELQKGMPKRRVGFVTWAIVALIAFIALPLCGYFAWFGTLRQRFDKKMSELARSGQPVTAEDMQAYYVLPDGVVDSTPLYVNALALVSVGNFSRDATGLPFVDRKEASPPPLPGTQWENQTDAETFLAKYEAALHSLHQAQRRGGQARYSLKFADGFGTLLSHVNELPVLVSLLQLEAYVKAHQQDSAGVSAAIKSALAAARSLQHEPIIVSQMSSYYQVNQILDMLEQLLPIVDFSDAELALLQDTLRSFDIRQSTRKAFYGEQGMCLVALGGTNEQFWKQFELTGTEKHGFEARAAWMISSMGTRYDDLLMYTDCMEHFVASIDKPWPEAIVEVENITDAARKATAGKLREIRYALTRTCLAIPAYPSHMLRQAAVTDAKLSICDTLVAAKRRFVSSGEFPSLIEQLVPDQLPQLPTDPLDPSRTLKLTKTKNVVRVSSVGVSANGDDEESRYSLPLPPPGEIRMELKVTP